MTTQIAPRRKRKKMHKDRLLLNIFAYSFVALFAMFCLAPFLIMISGSLSAQSAIIVHGYTLWPRDFSTRAYDVLFAAPDVMLGAFSVSVIVTASGTVLSLLLCSMAAYALGRKNFGHRNKVAFVYYFTTLFNGGLVPYYIVMVNHYQMKNNPLALVLPGLVSVWNLLLLRNFMKNNIPDSLIESAKIDGAGEFTVYVRIAMPLMVPALMAIGFFTAITYWNDWFTPMLFIDQEQLVPLQYKLYKMLNTMNALAQIAARSKDFNMPKLDLPGETIKLAMAVVAAAPIMFLYSFIQKYFVKGVTIGAVNG